MARTLYRCPKCSLLFTSRDAWDAHNLRKHEKAVSIPEEVSYTPIPSVDPSPKDTVG